MDVNERADIELSRLIEKRHDPRDGDALLEPAYAESVRRYNAKIQAALREEWSEYHRQHAARLRANLEALAAEHEARAQALKGEA